MSDRQIIVVDVESTGLGPRVAILEVAAINLDTGDEYYFAPYVHPEDLNNAEPAALQINRYYERGVWRDSLDLEASQDAYQTLSKMLAGNTLAGSNPTFDARLLQRVQIKIPSGLTYKSLWRMGEPWHHRLLDLSAYAAGKLAIPPNDLPGASTVCELLGVENEGPHTALGDARAAAECFRLLMWR